MSRYATDSEVVQFFASHGIVVTDVHRVGMSRHLKVQGQPMTLPMPASPDECLRRVRDFANGLASHPAAIGHNIRTISHK